MEFILRPHPLWYIGSSWRLLLLFCVLLGVYFVFSLLEFFGVPTLLLWLAVIALLLLHGARWIADDLNAWLFRYYILTDWRIVDNRGFLYQVRRQSGLDRIQQVRVLRSNILASWLDIGDIHFTTAGESSDVIFAGVHHPRQVALQVQLAQLNRGSKHLAQPVEVRNPAVRAVMERFEEQDHPAPPPPAPHRSAHRHIPIELLPNEVVLECIHRHWFNYLMRAWGAFATALGGLLLGGLLGRGGGAEVGASPLVILVLGLVVGGIWALGVYLDFADDVLVLTTHRVIDLDRYFYVFSESAAEATYKKIQDIQVEIPTIGQMLGFGTIHIETAGRAKDLEMDYMPRPLAIQDRIFTRIDAAETRSERTARRYRRMEFRRWMGTLLNGMLADVPDVRGTSLVVAAGHTRAAGLRLVVSEERAVPGQPPGRVLDQVPRGGATALLGSEVSVIVAARP